MREGEAQSCIIRVKCGEEKNTSGDARPARARPPSVYNTISSRGGPARRGGTMRRRRLFVAGVFIIFIFPVSTKTADTLHYNVLSADNATSTFVCILC